ncbi:MAG: putative Ig domain-containing protein [bacterium]
MRSTLRLTVLLTLLAGACGNSDGDGNHPPDAAVPPDPVDVTGPLGRIDFEYSHALTSWNPDGGATTYTLAAGELPAGLTLDALGSVTGIPIRSGHYEAEIWIEGDCGNLSCRQVVNLDIDVAPIILLSGYGPFEGVEVNPSWGAVAPLDATLIGGYDVRAIEVPVLWDEAPAMFLAEYVRLRPPIAIGSGVAMGELFIRLESTAANFASGEDIDGNVKHGGPIDIDEPDELSSTLPLADLLELLEQHGFPVAISDNAGAYLCNYLFFKIMQRLSLELPGTNIIGGFVHVPGEDVVSVPEMTEAWVLMLEYLVSYHQSLQQKLRRAGDRPYAATVHHAPRYLRPGAYR